jgi:hypothetical protein
MIFLRRLEGELLLSVAHLRIMTLTQSEVMLGVFTDLQKKKLYRIALGVNECSHVAAAWTSF